MSVFLDCIIGQSVSFTVHLVICWKEHTCLSPSFNMRGTVYFICQFIATHIDVQEWRYWTVWCHTQEHNDLHVLPSFWWLSKFIVHFTICVFNCDFVMPVVGGRRNFCHVILVFFMVCYQNMRLFCFTVFSYQKNTYRKCVQLCVWLSIFQMIN